MNDTKRRIVNVVMSSLSFGAATLSIAPLILILAFLVYQGASSVNLDFFIHLPKPVGEPGGGWLIVCSIIAQSGWPTVAIPLGILGSLYLAGGATRAALARAVHRGRPGAGAVDRLQDLRLHGAGAPVRQFSALAGGFALPSSWCRSFRTTEGDDRLVPRTFRRPAWASVRGVEGGPAHRDTAARAGIVTGVMVAMARSPGDGPPPVAALGNRFWHGGSVSPSGAALQIYAYAIAPYDDWHRQAWAGALVLITLVLITSLAARLATRRRVAAR